ncbi:FAST kinase domain-containing protein 4 [Eleutherodactylus coqui]|uniref:FAST kinase domain-containing protein 4 n=1 Tax=Eleutherodactylus coqui TaxID=57060 RepID=A0A8J6JXK8_ELECQ|nr:hypothetical protein GDO78_022332 [Eleutherodactylus coqui]
MAARLVQRFSRLLAASPSSVVPSCSIPSECIRACHPIHATLARALPLHTSALCRYTDSLPARKQQENPEVNKDFVAIILSTTDLEELLKMSAECNRDGNKAAAIINQIAKVMGTSNPQVLMDRRFRELLSLVDKRIRTIWNTRLISVLRALYTLQVDEKDHFLQSVETEVHWRLRKIGVELLERLARFIVPYNKTEYQKMLVSDLAKIVELRWTEVQDKTTLLSVISNLGPISKTLLPRMEDKVLEFAQFFTPEESRTLIMALAAQNYRSLSILRALSFHLVQKTGKLAPSVIVDLAYAYAKLNFSPHEVLQKLVSDLLPKVPELYSKEMTGIIRSFASLRFCNFQFCEAIAQACLEHSRSLTPTQLTSIILSFAYLDFLPSQQEQFFTIVVQHLSTEMDSLSATTLVDLVWSLCVLRLVTPAFLQKALDPKVYNQLIRDTSYKSANYRLKLLHLNTTAQLECPEYRGPFLPPSLVRTEIPLNEGNRLSVLQTDLRKVLQDIFPDKGTCLFNVKTVYGHDIDAEFVLDSENNPLALTNFEDPRVPCIKGTNVLPEGARRFAVRSWEFSNFCLRSKNLTGWSALCRRHLRAAGYLVVEVPFYEWQDLKSEWQKSAFLKDQIKKVVAEQMSL